MFVTLPKTTLFHKFVLYENKYLTWLCHFSETCIHCKHWKSCIIMSSCPICKRFFKQHLALHLQNNSNCRTEYQKWRAGPIECNIPKVVKFTSQSMPSQNRVANNLFQW